MTGPVTARAAALTRRLAVPIILGWVVLAGVLNALVPQLETVVAEHSAPFLADDTRSSVALVDMARTFGQGETNNAVYVALLSDEPLDDTVREYYADLVAALRAEPLVDSVTDLWSDPVAGAAAESADQRMVYAQLWLQGNMGEPRAFAAIDRVEDIVADSHPPAGLRTFVTGPPVVIVDEFRAADRDVLVISSLAFVIILAVLLVVYRSLSTALIPLISVGLALLVARPVIAWLGSHELIGASMFAAAMSAALILGAGADYAIFYLGRYHESRRAGRSRERAYFDAYHGITHIIIASALTIAGACACLSAAQISVLKTSGIPCAIGILTGLAAALTLTPALVVLGGRFGLLDPVTGTERHLRWRRFGSAVVRWPQPTFVAAAVALGSLMLWLPTMTISYDEVGMQAADTAAVRGLAELDAHFPNNQATPDFVTISSDHDMRNPSDAVAIEEVTRALVKVADVAAVQSITRPTGRLLPESLLVNQASALGAQAEQDLGLVADRAADLHRVGEGLTEMLAAVDAVTANLTGTGQALETTEDRLSATAEGLGSVRQSARELDQLLDPLRTMVSQNPGCEADLGCNTARMVLRGFEASPLPGALDGTVQAADAAGGLAGPLGDANASVQATVAGLTAMRANLAVLQSLTDRAAATLDLLTPQLDTATGYLREIDRNYGASESASFYLPQQVFDDPRFKVALDNLYSPDGHSTRLLVFGSSPAFGREGIDRAYALEQAANDALRGGRLDGATVRVGGIGATFADVERIVDRDFTLIAIVTLLLVFSIVLVVLRALVAAVVVVTTVAVSYGTALGAATLVWQHLAGLEIHWAVPPLAFIALVAVGSDYNLLFTARFREEAPAGLRIGIIRAFAGTGSVVTVAGVVFAATMFAMLGSSLTNVMQLGSTVGMGLLIDTFIVRAVVVPAVATKLGMWFWWPLPRREVLGPPRPPAKAVTL